MAAPKKFDRDIAVDWSGAREDAHRKKIRTADLKKGSCELRNNRTREEVTQWLIDDAGTGSVLVGLDFVF